MKSIDMQLSLPRTQEVGKLQGDLQQRNQMNVLAGTEAIQKEETQKQKSVVKQEQKGNVQNNREEASSGQQHSSEKRESKSQKEERKAKHPYKGNLIDYSS
ncbi:hypothetical protein [Bacillus carboniphilus]